MLEFGALPPEINSGRMYAGPGSASMMAAASAWDALAAQLENYAAGYSSVLSELHGQNWSGSASIAMDSATVPYISWTATTAAQAEQAANQARTAAAAFETAFIATVPPPVVMANRILLATLVATNFLGQNTPAIAATEAEYAEMWAQDAIAMYGYAASSSAAARLTPFQPPPQTTNAGGQAAQTTATAQATTDATTGQAQTMLSELMAALSGQLQNLGTTAYSAAESASSSTAVELLAESEAAIPAPVLTSLSDFTAITNLTGPAWNWVFTGSNYGSYCINAVKYYEKHLPKPELPSPHTLVNSGPGSGAAGMRGPVLVSMGRAAPIGHLSVPPSWASATPAQSADAELPESEASGLRVLPPWAANQPTNTPGGAPTTAIGPTTGAGEHHSRNAVFRMRDRRFKMPRPALGG